MNIEENRHTFPICHYSYAVVNLLLSPPPLVILQYLLDVKEAEETIKLLQKKQIVSHMQC